MERFVNRNVHRVPAMHSQIGSQPIVRIKVLVILLLFLLSLRLQILRLILVSPRLVTLLLLSTGIILSLRLLVSLRLTLRRASSLGSLGGRNSESYILSLFSLLLLLWLLLLAFIFSIREVLFPRLLCVEKLSLFIGIGEVDIQVVFESLYLLRGDS